MLYQENLNPAFWEALEAYIRGRIVEQVTSEPVKVTEEGDKVTYTFSNGGQFVTYFAPNDFTEAN